MSFFDDYVIDGAHEVVKAVFSDAGEWFPPDGADSVTDDGFFIDPTKSQGVGQNGTFIKNIGTYDVDSPVFEYMKGQYAGLKEAADQKKTQFIVINGLRYQILKVKAAYDGHTLYAILSKSPT